MVNKGLSFALATALAGCGAQQLPAQQYSAAASDTMTQPAVFAHHLTFRYLGKPQTFTVPKHITSISVIAIGGKGGGSPATFGGRVSALIPVRPGERLLIYVGGNGKHNAGGYNGGGKGGYYGYGNDPRNGWGGGGATDIRIGGDLLADRVLVAGAGGGQGGEDDVKSYQEFGLGGGGGTTTGGDGEAGYPQFNTYNCTAVPIAGCGGNGGAPTAGGAGGTGGSGEQCAGGNGFGGSFGVGGRGARVSGSHSNECGGLGGGGGGGYYGGGGGGAGGVDNTQTVGGGGGGGGGSSYVERRAANVHMWRGWVQNPYGLIVLRWD